MSRKREKLAQGKRAAAVASAMRSPWTGPPPAVWAAVRGLVVLALAIAGYLAWHALTGGRPIGCGPESGCDKVLHSRWAYWFGMPVSLFALGTYALLLGAGFRVGPSCSPSQRALAWRVLVSAAVAVLGAALWFVALQAVVLRSFCRFCLVAHGCGLLASALILRAAPWRRGTALPGAEDLPPVSGAKSVFVGLAAVAALALGQLAHQPRSFAVTSLPVGTNTAQTTATAGPSPRLFSFYDGRFTLDLREVPVMGAPDRPRVVVSLFDYTCHHCQMMHHVLREVQAMFSNDLVIASLPMPLAPGCNPLVKAPHPDHEQACDYARLGLAVWRADRAKHPEFDDWLFASPRPPALTQAVLRAEQLVGAAALAKARSDPWIEAQLRFNVAVYEVAYRAGQGRMPQMIVGTNVALGMFPKPELLSLLERQWGLRPPP